MLDPGIFDYIEGDDIVWEHDPLEDLSDDGELMAYRHDSFWQCMSLEPEYDAHIDRRIADRGLQDRIFKVGYQSNVPRWTQAMNIVVHASQAEPFGMVIVEAMLAGTPVLATRAGGPVEIVQEPDTGVLVPPGDPEALATAVQDVLSSPNRARAMAQAAQAYARRRFSVEQMQKGIKEAIGEVLASE